MTLDRKTKLRDLFLKHHVIHNTKDATALAEQILSTDDKKAQELLSELQQAKASLMTHLKTEKAYAKYLTQINHTIRHVKRHAETNQLLINTAKRVQRK